MPSDSFLIARQRGKPAQKALANYLRRYDEIEEVPDGFFQPYDLKLKNVGTTLEVKYDLKAEFTGNIALELEALNHSEADILAICWGTPIKACYLLDLKKAREFARTWPNKIYAGEFGGEIALVRRSLFLEQLKPEVIAFGH